METRERVMTEKGSEFKEKLLERTYRGAIREWRKQANKVRNAIADSDESEALRNERSFLETRFDIIVSTFDRLYEFLEANNEARVDEAMHEFDEVDKENSEVLKAVNERITDIKRSVEDLERLRHSKSNEGMESSGERNVKLPKETCSQYILDEYLDSQANSVSQFPVTSSIDNPVTKSVMSHANSAPQLPVTSLTNPFTTYVTPQGNSLSQLPVNPIFRDNLVDTNVWRAPNPVLSQGQVPGRVFLSTSTSQKRLIPTATESNTNANTADLDNVDNGIFNGEHTLTFSTTNPFNSETIKTSSNPFAHSTPITNLFKAQYHILDTPIDFSSPTAPQPLAPIVLGNRIKPKISESDRHGSQDLYGVSSHPRSENQPSLFTHDLKPEKSLNVFPESLSETSNPSRSKPQTTSSPEDTLSRLADILFERRSKDSLPLPEPEIFRGDLLHYPHWLKSFETIVEGQTKRVSERLYYLGRYTAGEAKEAIKGYVNQDSERAYHDAKSVLRDRYGNPFLVANAYRRKINEWPKIPANDGDALRKFSDFLNQTLSAMRSISFLSTLNDPEENQKMTRKLPSYLMNRWGRIVDSWLSGAHTANLLEDCIDRDSSSYPPFSDFCKFMEREARIACNPIISHRAFAAHDTDHLRRPTAKPSRPPATRNVAAFKVNTDIPTDHTSEQENNSTSERKPYCAMCGGDHYLDTCMKFLELSQQQRKEFIIKDGRCLGCLRKGHKNKDCKRKRTCEKCQGRHPTVLHDEAYESRQKTTTPTTALATSHRIEGTMHDGTTHDTSSLIVPVWLSHGNRPGEKLLVYALLDDQSDSCFIKSSIVDKLELDAADVKLRLSTMLEERVIDCKKVNGLIVQGFNETAEIPLPDSYSRDEIPARRSQIPRPETALKWPHLESIAYKLTPYQQNIEVGLLIGSNCARAIKPLDVIPGKDDDPYAVRTTLGWGVIGSVDPNNTLIAQSCVDNTKCRFAFNTQCKEELVTPQQVRKMFELDFNDHRINTEQSLSHDERRFLKALEDNVTLNDDGHYEMPLPFKDESSNLPNNRQIALKRLDGLKKRMSTDAVYKERYSNFMADLIEKGHAEKVPVDELANDDGKVWYIPHHGVYHPKKPDKIRVVFDASAQFQGTSLNQCLLPSPDLTNNPTGVLCRFRKETTAIMCDIEGMFLQVKVPARHRNYLRFLWWENGELESVPQEYRMTVHLFGAGSSPGCANFALQRTADDNEARYGAGAADFVRNDFYVDDGLRSVASTQEAIELLKNTKEMCQAGGFRLHKFLSNDKGVISSLPVDERSKAIQDIDLSKDTLPVERALGVQWHVETDQFQFKIEPKNKPLTRRSILSAVSSVFDPLGLVSPFVLKGKQILQQLCKDGIGWDERLPDPLYVDWQRWNEDLARLSELSIPRCYKPTAFGELKSVELHNFSDACLFGYGQCSYLRLEDTDGKIHCTLAMAKSRVTPLKPITVPRLELAAALMSANVSAFLKRELKYPEINEYFYTDSMVVLGYICNDARRFHTYVANRVQQIRDLTSPSQWRYITSAGNPADEASRGLNARDLIDDKRWWNGPDFLWDKHNDMPATEASVEISSDDPEVKKSVCLKVEVKEQFDLEHRVQRFSNWHKAKRGVAACMKLQDKFRRKESSPRTPVSVDVATIQRAEREIIKELQAKHFADELASLRSNASVGKDSSIVSLDPFLDHDGILRVGGRLSNANTLEYEARHPMILPKSGHVTHLVIRNFHEKTHHQGRGRTMAEIRSSGYWIVGGRSAVGHYVNKCVTCKRLRGTQQYQKMADLPEDRLAEAPPFTYSAVDYFGPFIVKEGRKTMKRYGVLFTCLSSRAIHLETAFSLTTDSFISAYRRFIGRRGPARLLRSDQGTNFVGAKNELKAALSEFNNAKITNELQKDNCDWVEVKMNVPHASHMGGVWERQIRTVRSILSSLLSQHGGQLDDESLNTLMVEAEAVVNSRPLTTDSSTDEFGVLSPNRLLTQKSTVVLPPPGDFQQADQYSKKRWRRVQYLANQFWSRWRQDFLQSLQQRQKWLRPAKNLHVGDLVLIKEDNTVRNKWKLARIEATMPSKDGLVRKVKLRTASSCKDHHFLERPVTKLVLLMSEDNDGVSSH